MPLFFSCGDHTSRFAHADATRETNIRFISATQTAFASNWRGSPADGKEPRIIDAFTQSKVKALEELKTLTADEAWLGWAADGLLSQPSLPPDEQPATL